MEGNDMTSITLLRKFIAFFVPFFPGLGVIKEECRRKLSKLPFEDIWAVGQNRSFPKKVKKLGDLMGDKSVSRWRANSRKSVALSRDQLDSIDLCVINDRKLNN
jgi:hypothetical protein